MSNRSGFVLVTVLWVLAILAVLALGFGRRAMLERQKAWYVLDHDQAMHMARGAVELAIVELRNKAALDEHHGQGGYTAFKQRWSKPHNLLGEKPYYALASDEDFKEDRCRYVIYDSLSRISLNDAPREMLEEVEGLSRKLVRTIMKKRDLTARQPYPERFYSVDELQLLDDFDYDAWYGDEDHDGLRKMLTVALGTGRININTASRDVLNAIPGLEAQVVDVILTRRPIKNFGILATYVSADLIAPVQKYCTVDSNRFTIETLATRRHGKIRALCTANVYLEGGIVEIETWNEDVDGV